MHFLRRGVPDLGALEPDRAGVGAVDAGDDVEQRGLARAVGADEAQDLAPLDREIDPVERGHAAEFLGEPAHFEESRIHGRHAGK